MDYAARHAALRAIKTLYADEGAAACGQHLLESLPDGRIKLYLTWKTLTVRRECEQVFRNGDYLPLKTHGGMRTGMRIPPASRKRGPAGCGAATGRTHGRTWTASSRRDCMRGHQPRIAAGANAREVDQYADR
ncbi:MAG: hypothetical protein ABI865_13990 [Nitrosospira sp.]